MINYFIFKLYRFFFLFFFFFFFFFLLLLFFILSILFRVQFNILCFQKIATYEKEIFTAPVFRSKPEIDVGFLHGGFWKYSAKPSNILPVDEDVLDAESEGKHTIQDDIVVGGQDIAAGLVRMGILPRLCYLLEVSMMTV
jgi:hypothetical protein